MTEQKHTALPFVNNYFCHEFTGILEKIKIRAINGRVVAEIECQSEQPETVRNSDKWVSECRDNAKFIVRACNSHYDLVKSKAELLKACRNAVILLCAVGAKTILHNGPFDVDKNLALLNSAIDKATK